MTQGVRDWGSAGDAWRMWEDKVLDSQKRRLIVAGGERCGGRGAETGLGEDVLEGDVRGLLVGGEVVEVAGGDVGVDGVAPCWLVVGRGRAEERHRPAVCGKTVEAELVVGHAGTRGGRCRGAGQGD